MIAVPINTVRRLLRPAFVVGALVPTMTAQSQIRQDRPGADTTCTPCRDFYRFVNRAWLDTVTIPPTASIVGPGYDALDRTLLVVKTILTEAAADTRSPLGSRTQQIGALYASCMDSVRAEKDGIQPLVPALAEIDAVQTPAQVAVVAARLQRSGVRALFGASVAADQKDTRHLMLVIAEGGLGLPNRDYYLREDARTTGLRRAYVESVTRTFELSGTAADAAAAMAMRVMELETALAKATMDAMARRDPEATYHKLSLAELRALAPALPWDLILDAWRARAPDSVIVRNPRFVTELGTMLEQTPVSDWRAYLRWRLLSAMSANLSSAFAKEAFRLSQHLYGAKEQSPRWNRCVSLANTTIGEMVGRAYVERVFPAAYKSRMITLIENLRAVLEERIRALEWMSESTKREALVKVAAMGVHAGYPDKWVNYSKLRLDRGSLVANLRRAREFESDRRMGRIGMAPDPDEWTIGVPQVFDGLAGPLNAITITAAAFQPPWFDPQADDATNYGALGFVIAHEMTHHFDVSGRRYDARANLRDWWSREDAVRYNEQAQRVVEQFNAYTVLDSLHVNGQLTVGENIADLGGVKIAFLAMKKAQSGKPREIIGGYTPEQRFFVGLARWYASQTRPEFMRQYLVTNGHAPDKYRVNGPLSNLPEFAEAFGCKEGDPMVRPASVRAEIW